LSHNQPCRLTSNQTDYPTTCRIQPRRTDETFPPLSRLLNADTKNYRSILNLPFLSNLIQELVGRQQQKQRNDQSHQYIYRSVVSVDYRANGYHAIEDSQTIAE
jgi:hypothetical protein